MATSELRARITADTAGYRRGMGDVRRIAASTAAGVTAAFASVLSARAIAGQLRQVVAYGESLDKAAARTGVTITGIQRLGLAAQLSGASMDDLEKALRTGARTLYDAERGSSTAVDAFRDLGLSVAALRAMDPEQQFRTYAEAISRVGDKSRRTALAMAVFGRSGTMMLPMLTEGAAGFRALTSEADKYGIVTERGVKAAAAFDDAMTRMATASRAVRSALATQAMEALAEIVDDLAARIGALQRSGDLDRWGRDIAAAVTGAATAVQTMGAVLRDHGAEIKVVLATWAGWRVWTLAAAAVVGVGNALAMLGKAMATETVMLQANTAAQVTNAAARTAAGRAAQAQATAMAASTVGINQASQATVLMAQGVNVGAESLSRFGAILGGLKMASYIGLTIEVVSTMVKLADAIREVGRAKEAAGLIDERGWMARARDYLPAWMGGGMGEGEVYRTAPAGEDRPRGTGAPDRAADGAAAERARDAKLEAEKKKADWWGKMTAILEDQRQAARRAAAVGDTAPGDIFRQITGGADPEAQITAADTARMVEYLEKILPGDPEGAIEIVRSRDQERRDKIKAAAEESARAWKAAAEDDRRVIQQALEDRARIAADIEDMEDRAARDEATERQQRRAARLDRRAAQWRAEAAETLRNAMRPPSEVRAERRADRRQERQQARLQRRFEAAQERDEQGLSVSRQGRELLGAYARQQAARRAEGAAGRIREGLEAAAVAQAMEPLRQAMKAVDDTLKARLPKEQR